MSAKMPSPAINQAILSHKLIQRRDFHVVEELTSWLDVGFLGTRRWRLALGGVHERIVLS